MLPPCSWKQELPIAGTEANACCLKQNILFHPKDESSQNQIVPFSSGISLNFLELYPLPRIRFHWNVQLVQGRQSQAGFSLPAPSSPCAPYHSVRLGSWIPAPTWDVGPACVFECMGEEENKGATRRSVCVCVWRVRKPLLLHALCMPSRNCGAPVGCSPKDYHPLPRKRREMLYSPLCFCFQGQRLLIIDLQPHYKSGAEGNLPCCL